MEIQEIEKRVKKVVSQVLNVPEDTIKQGSRFVEDLGAESIQSLELVAGFESEFDISMEEDAALNIKTVEKAIEFIKKYVDAK
ncbi:MAG: acyl carrier protein [Candidatus Omnitrophica bacterium]|nr:acyl carrier protein [Candidatus Omnitrophota bacterium]